LRVSRYIEFVTVFFLESGQELMSSDDSPCNMSVGAGFSPVCVQAELVRPSAGERCSIPVTADIAAFVVRDTALIQTVALVDSPPPTSKRHPGALVEFSADTDDCAAGQVLAVNDEQVKVDFNHLLIGENVKFEVEGLVVIERDG